MTNTIERHFGLIAAQQYVACGAQAGGHRQGLWRTPITLKRAVKQYRGEGIKGFFAPRVTRSVLTAEVETDSGLPLLKQYATAVSR